MGGSIDCHSTFGEGSKFWLTLSLEVADPKNLLIAPYSAKNMFDTLDPASKISLKVLLVDDDEINLELNELLLTQHGHEVLVAASGQQAISILKDQNVDLVLMDCQMPIQDGWETTQVIRKSLERSADDLVIVALTAHSNQEELDRCLQSGMNDVIQKPLNIKEFSTLVDFYFRTDQRNQATTDLPPNSGVCPADATDLYMAGKNTSFWDRIYAPYFKLQYHPKHVTEANDC